MPVFKVTATEEVKRRLVAYVEAPSAEAAEAWASTAPDTAFRHVHDVGEPWCEVNSIDPAEAPDGWRVAQVS